MYDDENFSLDKCKNKRCKDQANYSTGYCDRCEYELEKQYDSEREEKLIARENKND